MPIVIALVVFVAVAAAVFAVVSLLDQRNAQARILRDRLTAAQGPAEQTVPDVALLRDECSAGSRLSTVSAPLERVSLCKKCGRARDCELEISSCCAPLPWCLRDAFTSRRNILSAGPARPRFFHPYAYASPCQKASQHLRRNFPSHRHPRPPVRPDKHYHRSRNDRQRSRRAVAGIPQLYKEEKFGSCVRGRPHQPRRSLLWVDVKFFVTAVHLQRETGGNSRRDLGQPFLRHSRAL